MVYAIIHIIIYIMVYTIVYTMVYTMVYTNDHAPVVYIMQLKASLSSTVTCPPQSAVLHSFTVLYKTASLSSTDSWCSRSQPQQSSQSYFVAYSTSMQSSGP